MRRRVLSLIVLLLLSSAYSGQAQSIQAGLSGVVIDQTGGALPGATVVIRTPDGTVVSSTSWFSTVI